VRGFIDFHQLSKETKVQRFNSSCKSW